jgi:hypothetical protein
MPVYLYNNYHVGSSDKSEAGNYAKTPETFREKKVIDVLQAEGFSMSVFFVTDPKTEETKKGIKVVCNGDKKSNRANIGSLFTKADYAKNLSFVNTIDVDEVDHFIESIEYAKKALSNNEIGFRTEFSYFSRTGIRMGIYYDKSMRTWWAYFWLYPEEVNSIYVMQYSNVNAVLEGFKVAKKKLEEGI